MVKGTFIISLDFELHWGGFEKWPVEQYRQYFLNTRKAIPAMLALFRKYDIHVTWAGVGLLFYETKRQLLEDMPEIKPTYTNTQLSAYNYINSPGIGEDEVSDPLHYGFSLLKLIQQTPHQEIASHTFAHYYCNEKGQTPEQFRHDLQAAQKAAARFGVTLRSLVFPRNQFNDDYLKVCHEAGFTSVRSNPKDWFWDIQSAINEPFWKRLNRGADAYIKLGKRTTFNVADWDARVGYPVCIPASRLLRPYRPKEFFLNTMKINRIKGELEYAARNNEFYHLWWHPHNFGNYPGQSLEHLEKILIKFKELRETSGMRSLTMAEVAEEVRS
jgi:peptidoglycan/xylan/chitin deacetylase (PgdA/CDA1 family)